MSQPESISSVMGTTWAPCSRRTSIEVLREQGAQVVPITEEIDSGWLT